MSTSAPATRRVARDPNGRPSGPDISASRPPPRPSRRRPGDDPYGSNRPYESLRHPHAGVRAPLRRRPRPGGWDPINARTDVLRARARTAIAARRALLCSPTPRPRAVPARTGASGRTRAARRGAFLDRLPSTQPGTALIRAEAVHTATNGTLTPGEILIRDGVIAAVGPTVDAPLDTRVYMAETVIPGMIDAHAHLALDRSSRSRIPGPVTAEWKASAPRPRRPHDQVALSGRRDFADHPLGSGSSRRPVRRAQDEARAHDPENYGRLKRQCPAHQPAARRDPADRMGGTPPRHHSGGRSHTRMRRTPTRRAAARPRSPTSVSKLSRPCCAARSWCTRTRTTPARP